jgi:hypothetical protein
MRKALTFIWQAVRYTLTAAAFLLLLGEPSDSTTLAEVVAIKGAAAAWFVYLYIRDGRKPQNEQVFFHTK